MQDQGLDVIAEGLGTLKNMAQDMNEVTFLLPLLFSLLVDIWYFSFGCLPIAYSTIISNSIQYVAGIG